MLSNCECLWNEHMFALILLRVCNTIKNLHTQPSSWVIYFNIKKDYKYNLKCTSSRSVNKIFCCYCAQSVYIEVHFILWGQIVRRHGAGCKAEKKPYIQQLIMPIKLHACTIACLADRVFLHYEGLSKSS